MTNLVDEEILDLKNVDNEVDGPDNKRRKTSDEDEDVDKEDSSSEENEETDPNEEDSDSDVVVLEEDAIPEHADESLRKFVSITGTDEAFAHSVLQDVSWSLQAALNAFFAHTDLSPTTTKQKKSEQNIKENHVVASDQQRQDLEGLEVSLMSWNIDGLDGSSISTRMKAVYKIIMTCNPDIVFLQEVVDREIDTIDRLGKNYDILYSNRGGSMYYTAILVSKMFEVVGHEVIHYPNSGMGRTLQIVEGIIGEQRVFLLNTHLESMKEHSNKRRVQFAFCMEKFNEILTKHPHSMVFFGGDLNIRDDELSGVPAGVADAWIAAGSDNKTRYTWDTRTNDNKQAFGARCRFDRIYWKGPLRRVAVSLEGRQRIRSCLCFPSDHWALNCTFS